jgi:hypothetical protein
MMTPVCTSPSTRPVSSPVTIGREISDVPKAYSVSVGASIPPDVVTGGILGVAFAITSGAGTETALLLAENTAGHHVGRDRGANGERADKRQL